jgi:hypothetical protein
MIWVPSGPIIGTWIEIESELEVVAGRAEVFGIGFRS